RRRTVARARRRGARRRGARRGAATLLVAPAGLAGLLKRAASRADARPVDTREAATAGAVAERAPIGALGFGPITRRRWYAERSAPSARRPSVAPASRRIVDPVGER